MNDSRRIFIISVCIAFLTPCLATGRRGEIEHIQNAFNRGHYLLTQNLILDTLQATPHHALKPELVLLLAASYFNAGETEQAGIILRSLKNMFPRFARKPACRILEASLHQQKGEYDRSLETLLDLDSDQALFQSAFLLELTQQSFAAVSRLGELKSKFPESALSHPASIALANSYLGLNEYESAKKNLQTLDSISDPTTRDLKAYLEGVIAYREGEREQGNAILSRLWDGQLQHSGQALKGVHALKGQDWPEAENAFKAATASTDGNVRMRAALGLIEVSLQTNRFENALAVCQDALMKTQNDEHRHLLILLRGISSWKLGRVNDALQDFDEIAQHGADPLRTKSLLLLTQTLWGSNNFYRLTTEIPSLIKETAGKENGANPSPDLDLCRLIVADANFSLKQYGEAETIYKTILAKAPPAKLAAQTVSGLATCLILQKKYEEASRNLEELLVRFGEDREVSKFVMLSQANLSWNEKKFADAATRYQRFTEIFPRDEKTPQALYLWGAALEKMNDFGPALATWLTLRNQFADSPYAFKSLVRSAALLEKSGDGDGARIYLSQLAESKNKEAAEAALLQLGNNFLIANEPIKAVAAYNQFAIRYPDSKKMKEVQEGVKQAFLLISLTDRKKLDELADEFQSCAFGGEALYAQAIDHLDKGDFKQAEAVFKKIWAEYPLTPSASAALFYQGESSFRAKDMAGAVKIFRQFEVQFPKHDLSPLARSRRATALVNLGYLDEALAAYDKIAKTSPQTAYAAEAYLSSAQIHEHKNNYPEEIKAYETFLDQYPRHEKANFVQWKLALLNKREGRYQASLAYLRQVRPAQGIASADDLNRGISELENIVSISKEKTR